MDLGVGHGQEHNRLLKATQTAFNIAMQTLKSIKELDYIRIRTVKTCLYSVK